MPAQPPPHYMNIYEKPAVGTDFIKGYIVYDYRHSINANGGFDTASFDVALWSVNDMQMFLDRYIGNRISIVVDNPAEPIWEGFINRMTFNSGGAEHTISLDQMANRIRTLYSQTSGDTTATQSAVSNNTTSQGLFGIKQEQIDLGTMVNGTGATIARDTQLAQRAYPKTSVTPGGGSGGLVHVECLGFYHTLTWESYYQSTTANVQLGNFVDTLIGATVNGTTFFDNTDLGDTAANTQTINQIAVKGDTIWDMLKKVQEMGDTSTYFVVGIGPARFSASGVGTRRAYYRQASTAVTYTALQSDGLRVRNLYGQLVDPWKVRPDTGIRIADMLVGWDGTGDNPTETYIMKIDYDANKQSCIWSGDDDISAEGVFNLKRFNYAAGKRFAAPRRLA